LRNLKTLKVHPVSFEKFPIISPSVEILSLNSITIQNIQQFNQKFGHLRNLKKLEFSGSSFSDGTIASEIIERFPFLELLNLSRSVLSDSFLDSLAFQIRTKKQIKLQKINICDCSNITGNGVSSLTNLGFEIVVEHSLTSVPRAFRLRDN